MDHANVNVPASEPTPSWRRIALLALLALAMIVLVGTVLLIVLPA